MNETQCATCDIVYYGLTPAQRARKERQRGACRHFVPRPQARVLQPPLPKPASDIALDAFGSFPGPVRLVILMTLVPIVALTLVVAGLGFFFLVLVPFFIVGGILSVGQGPNGVAWLSRQRRG